MYRTAALNRRPRRKEDKYWCATSQAEDGTVFITNPPTCNKAPKRFARLPGVVWSVREPGVGVVGAAVTEADEADVCVGVLLATLLLDGVALTEVVLLRAFVLEG